MGRCRVDSPGAIEKVTRGVERVGNHVAEVVEIETVTHETHQYGRHAPQAEVEQELQHHLAGRRDNASVNTVMVAAYLFTIDLAT